MHIYPVTSAFVTESSRGIAFCSTRTAEFNSTKDENEEISLRI